MTSNTTASAVSVSPVATRKDNLVLIVDMGSNTDDVQRRTNSGGMTSIAINVIVIMLAVFSTKQVGIIADIMAGAACCLS